MRRVAFLGLTVGFLGCNAILGIQGGEFDPPPDDAGTDATSDSSVLADSSVPETSRPEASTDADAELPDAGDAGADSGCGDLENDARNCGTCGHDCAAGKCQLGQCQPFTVVENSENEDLTAITLSPTHVIYTNATTGEVLRALKDGSTVPAPIFLGAPGADHGVDIGWSNGFVYFFDYGADFTRANLVRCPDTGCTALPEAVLGPLDTPASLTMTANGLVTAEGTTSSRVLRCHQLPCEETPDLVSTGESAVSRVAVNDDKAVAWTTIPNPQSVRLRIGTNDIATPATSFGIFAVVVTDTEVVWAVASTAIRAAPLAGGPTRDVVPSVGFVERIALSGHTLFYSDPPSIKAVDLSVPGSEPRTVAGQLDSPRSLAVDDKAVYWVEVGGRIRGIAR